MTKGWPREPDRHRLSAMGIKTVTKGKFKDLGRYGGMKSFGGLKHYTEYEVGIGHTFENLHCILGSIQKILRSDIDMELKVRTEMGHIEEEMGLIEDNVEEYSKDIYLLPFSEGGVWYEEMREKTIEDLRDNIPEIKERAQENLHTLQESDLPRPVEDVVTLCYHMYITICNELLAILHKDDLTPADNIFESREVRKQYEDVERAVENLWEEYA